MPRFFFFTNNLISILPHHINLGYIRIRNNYFLVLTSTTTDNIVENCSFIKHSGDPYGGAIYLSNEGGNNQFLDCEFGFLQGHGIYIDGNNAALGSGGNNTVTRCRFHNQLYQAGLHIKNKNNKIYDNEFYNSSGGVGLSIYSEYSPSYANDNEIYNNTFTNMTEALWIGHNPANYTTLRNKIHDNVFTDVINCFRLNPWTGAINTTEDTWIYYNKFYSCTNIFPASGSSANLIKNTVIAYNDFDESVTNLWIETCDNTMIYGNTGMNDFNVPDPLPIPPP